MKPKYIWPLVLGLMLCLCTGAALAYEVSQGPTGVIIWNEDLAMNGYTLISPRNNTSTYLIDMEGYIVHQWDTAYLVAEGNPGSVDRRDQYPGLHCRLLPNGNLLRGFKPSVFRKDETEIPNPAISGAAGGVQEFDWNGNLVWQYILKSDTAIQHHTFDRMPNGNTLILGWEKVECDEVRALGLDIAYPCSPNLGMWMDYIEEVDSAGEVVWSWHVKDHVGTGPGQFDINALQDPIIESSQDWTHGNTVEYDALNDYILTNFRNFGELYVIDHGASFIPGDPAQSIANAAGPLGEVIFRWGNPSAYGAGDAPRFNDDGDQQLFGSHCAVFLGTGDNTNFGKAGDILVFDNGWHRPEGNRSRAVIITPDYAIWEDSEVLWESDKAYGNTFYTGHQGAVQMLENGNIFFSISEQGHLFQLALDPNDPDEEDYIVVWDFVMPLSDDSGTPFCSHLAYDGQNANNWIHRAHQYSADHPGLVGKNLSRKGHIAGNCTQLWDLWETGIGSGAPAISPPPPPAGWGISVVLPTGEGGGGGAGGGTGGGTGGGGGY